MTKKIILPYLHITVHDNDFTSYYKILGSTIRELFNYAGCKYPASEDDYKILKPFIANIWYSLHNILDYAKWYDSEYVHYEETPKKYFDEHLTVEILDLESIPKDDDCQSIYIPLIDGSEEILRR
jgi:hypothetical protein